MAEKSKSKKEKKIESSSEEEEEEDEDEDESPSPVENKFANDGSFLELFRQKMAEQEKDGGKDKSSAQIPAPHTETEDGETQLKAYQVLRDSVPSLHAHTHTRAYFTLAISPSFSPGFHLICKCLIRKVFTHSRRALGRERLS